MSWAAFERSSYQVARSWQMQPSEFWQLPICDFWAELDSKIEENRRLQELTEQFRSGKNSGTVFTHAEWEEARRKHREKMRK